MSEAVLAPEDEALLATLSDEQRTALAASRALRVGDDLVWIEPEGRVRREKLARLYYVRTARGIYRWSKIEEALIEV